MKDDVSANHSHHHAAGAYLLMGYGEDIAVQHLKISDFADLYRSAYRFFPFLLGRIDGVHPHAVRHANCQLRANNVAAGR